LELENNKKPLKRIGRRLKSPLLFYGGQGNRASGGGYRQSKREMSKGPNIKQQENKNRKTQGKNQTGVEKKETGRQQEGKKRKKAGWVMLKGERIASSAGGRDWKNILHH